MSHIADVPMGDSTPMDALAGLALDLAADAARTADRDVHAILTAYARRASALLKRFRPDRSPPGQFLPARRALVDALHSLGARTMGEMLWELERAYGIPDLEVRLARYADADRAVMEALGALDWPTLPPPREVA